MVQIFTNKQTSVYDIFIELYIYELSVLLYEPYFLCLWLLDEKQCGRK